MKKSLISTALAILCCVACEKTADRFAPTERPVYVSEALTVSLDDATVIPESASLSAWRLVDSTGSFYTSLEGGYTAEFTLNPGQTAHTKIAYAIYPDVAVDSLHHGVFTLALPAEQTATCDRADACIYAGHVLANEAELHNTCGTIKFTVGYCDAIGECILNTSGENPMAGKALLTMTDTASIAATGDNVCKKVTLIGEMQKDSTYAIAVLPGTYKLSYSMKTVSGMPIEGVIPIGEYTVKSGDAINVGAIGAELPPVEPGNRNAVIEEFRGSEAPANPWKVSDNISILFADSNSKFTLKSGAGSAIAVFTGEDVQIRNSYGVAPYDAEARFEGDTVITTLPSSQIIEKDVPGQFAIAKADENAVYQFKNAIALIPFKVEDGDVAEVVLEGNKGEFLAGKVGLVWNNGAPVWTVVEGVTSISMKPVAGQTTFEAGSYYASVLPQVLEAGYTITMKSGTGQTIKTVSVHDKTFLLRSEVLNDIRIAQLEAVGGDETLECKWIEGSTINIMSSTQNEEYKLIAGQGTAEGTFSGMKAGGTVFGLYPYDKNAVCGTGSVTCTLKSFQALKAGDVNALSIATSDVAGGNLVFKQVCGFVSFQIKGDNIGQVVITGNNNEDIAGKISVSFNPDGNPVYEVSEGQKSITIKASDGNALTPGTYYAAVLPQTLTDGITLTASVYNFKTDAIVKQKSAPLSNLVKKCSGSMQIGRAAVKSVGGIDKGILWSYGKTNAPVRLAGLRGTDKNHGLYIDFSTGRLFYAIGAYNYSENCDLLMVTNTSNGFAPSSIKSAAALTNSTNLNKFGTSTVSDQIGNSAWTTKSDNTFSYVAASELTDEQFEALATVDQIKEIYDAHSSEAVHTYYDVATPANSKCVTNANRTGIYKYLVVKTDSAAEGTGYAIMKFIGLNGSNWYIEFFYKFGLE